MDGLIHSLRANWNLFLAVLLLYAVIGIYLGPGYFFISWFLSGCGYIIHIALKR